MSTFLTDREVAAEFGISWEQVQQRCRTGQWHHHRVGRKYLFDAADIEANKALCKVGPKPAPTETWGRRRRA